MTASGPPTRPVTVKRYHRERLRGRALLAIATGALGLQEALFLWLWFTAGVSWPPPLSASVMLAGPAVFLAFFWTLAWPSASAVDLELAEQWLRLPFRKQRARHGWRRTAEVRFLAIRPDRDAVAQARTRLWKVRARGPRRWAYRLRIAEWAKWGGLVAITDDEVVWVRESFEVLRFIDDHWRASVN